MDKYHEEKEKDKNYSWINYYVGENEHYFLRISFPYSNRITDNKILEEYNSLKIDADETISRLTFPKQEKKVEISPEEYIKQHVQDSVYTNPEYGWTFRVPENWEGKYVIDDGDSVYFRHNTSEGQSTLFWIIEMRIEEWKKIFVD